MSVYEDLLKKSALNQKLSGKAGRVIGTLFLYHPDHSQKQGVGVTHLCVGKHENGSRAFCIVRKDGNQESFSLKKCIWAWQDAPKKEEVVDKKDETTHTASKATPISITNVQKRTYREQILTLLDQDKQQRKEIITHIYGKAATPSNAKYIGHLLKQMVQKGEIQRVKTGVYAKTDIQNNQDITRRVQNIAEQLASLQRDVEQLKLIIETPNK